MNLSPIRRRILWPSRPFADHERGTMFSVTLVVYMLLTAPPFFWLGDHFQLAGQANDSLASRLFVWTWILGFVPFAMAFHAAWIRLLRTPKPKRSTATITESDAKSSAWASSVLDKKR